MIGFIFHKSFICGSFIIGSGSGKIIEFGPDKSRKSREILERRSCDNPAHAFNIGNLSILKIGKVTLTKACIVGL